MVGRVVAPYQKFEKSVSWGHVEHMGHGTQEMGHGTWDMGHGTCKPLSY